MICRMLLSFEGEKWELRIVYFVRFYIVAFVCSTIVAQELHVRISDVTVYIQLRH